MSLLDSLFGIQRIFLNGVELVTRKSVNFSGAVNAVDNPALGRTDITVASDSLAFTALIEEETVDAAYGQFLVLGYADDPGPTINLPAAASLANGRVGALQTVNAVATFSAAGSDVIQDGAGAYVDTAGQSIVLQSDGVSAWWIVSRVS